jgi:hypothetical protein
VQHHQALHQLDQQQAAGQEAGLLLPRLLQPTLFTPPSSEGGLLQGPAPAQHHQALHQLDQQQAAGQPAPAQPAAATLAPPTLLPLGASVVEIIPFDSNMFGESRAAGD